MNILIVINDRLIVNNDIFCHTFTTTFFIYYFVYNVTFLDMIYMLITYDFIRCQFLRAVAPGASFLLNVATYFIVLLSVQFRNILFVNGCVVSLVTQLELGALAKL